MQCTLQKDGLQEIKIKDPRINPKVLANVLQKLQKKYFKGLPILYFKL